jgi:RNA polymerase sigma-70 factor (ECF subfamily)
VRQRRVVDAYLAATREGDFAALVTVLHPDVVLHADATASPSGVATVLRGTGAVAEGAAASSARAQHTVAALIDGTVGLVMTLAGKQRVALVFTVANDRIEAIDVVADPIRLAALHIEPLTETVP